MNIGELASRNVKINHNKTQEQKQLNTQKAINLSRNELHTFQMKSGKLTNQYAAEAQWELKKIEKYFQMYSCELML